MKVSSRRSSAVCSDCWLQTESTQSSPCRQTVTDLLLKRLLTLSDSQKLHILSVFTQQPFHRSPNHPAGSAGPGGSAPPPVNHTNSWKHHQIKQLEQRVSDEEDHINTDTVKQFHVPFKHLKSQEGRWDSAGHSGGLSAFFKKISKFLLNLTVTAAWAVPAVCGAAGWFWTCWPSFLSVWAKCWS